MLMNRRKRNNLDKENFMSGNRQKWCLIFSVMGIVIMVLTAFGVLPNPEPFLQFFLSIGVTFILGASATAVMNSWKTTTISENKRERSQDDRYYYDRMEEDIPEQRKKPYGQQARGNDEY